MGDHRYYNKNFPSLAPTLRAMTSSLGPGLAWDGSAKIDAVAAVDSYSMPNQP